MKFLLRCSGIRYLTIGKITISSRWRFVLYNHKKRLTSESTLIADTTLQVAIGNINF